MIGREAGAAAFDARPIGAIAAQLVGAKLDRKTRTRLGRGDSFRTNQPVWRNSYYVGQIEDRLWKPFADGTVRGGKRLAGALLQAARTIERKTRQERKAREPGKQRGVLGQVGVDVLEALLEIVDFMTGRLEPAIATLATRTGYSYSAVHAALKRLREQGFLHWVRRSKPVDNPVPGGPRVEQVANAYVLLVPAALKGLMAGLFGKSPLPSDDAWRRDERKRSVAEMLATLSPDEFMRATWTGDPLQGETLKRIASLMEANWSAKGESSKCGETGGLILSP